MNVPCPKCESDVDVDVTSIRKGSTHLKCPSCKHLFLGRFPQFDGNDGGQIAPPVKRRRTTANKLPPAHEQEAARAPERQRRLKSSRRRKNPERIGSYEIQEEISRGGMGIVYKALDPNLRRQVAIKVLLAGDGASDEDVKRFQREAQASARLQHSNIVHIHAVGVHEDKPYFVMDFIEGQTVKQLLEAGKISPRLAMAITESAAEGLDHAAQKGVIHRDVKPANIIVDNMGHVSIMDFGLAKRVDEDLHITQSGTTMGTPVYMSPEQAEGNLNEVDGQSDVYSLGAVLYEMLTGQPPFDGQTTMAVLRKVLDDDPVAPRKLNPKIHRDIETICLKCLEKDKPRRYLSGRELAEDVRRFNAGEPISAAPVGAMSLWVRKAYKHLHITLSILAAVCFGIAALGYNLVDSARKRTALESKQRGEVRAALRKGNKLLQRALTRRAGVSKVDVDKFEADNLSIIKLLREAEALFREASFKSPASQEAKERIEDVTRHVLQQEVDRLVFKARNFLKPQSKKGSDLVPPPNFPAALAFAEEVLSRNSRHREAIEIRKQAMGIRAVTITVKGGSAEVYVRRLADEHGGRIQKQNTASKKGKLLGWTPVTKHEMQPGWYVLSFVLKGMGVQEATLFFQRDSDPNIEIEINAKPMNMVMIPKGLASEQLGEDLEVPAFLIDRYEYPNKAGAQPRVGVTSVLEAKQLCRLRGKKLCTTLQWIRACVGPKEFTWPYGDKYQPEYCAMGFDPDARKQPFPSGRYSRCRSARGVFDMSGNVAEWTDPGEHSVSEEVIYGGDWTGNTRHPHLTSSCRLAAEIPEIPDMSRVGVRCCMEIKKAASAKGSKEKKEKSTLPRK